MISSAFGPITATFFVFAASGRTPVFFSRTTEAWAISRARRSCAGASLTLNGVRAYLTRSGGSNIPSLKRAKNSRVSATSISCSVISFFPTAVVSDL
jgi:hypothetical protein